jgi:iron complex outermembrane receptor protein
VRLAVDDQFLADGDDSGERDLTEWSYLAGLSHALAQNHRIYASVGTAFETPTTNELANPAGGGFNPELESQRALNRELGIKGENSRLRYEAALFSVRVRGELVPYELAGQPGRTFYRNAGESRRNGIELAASYLLDAHWRLSAAYTYSDFEFERFQRGGSDFAGNTIPGIPRQTLFAEAALDAPTHFASLNLLEIGRLHADDANTVEVDGYTLINLRAGLRRELGPMLGELYAGINNLGDEEHNANVRINAFGGRYFEPAPGRHYYAGIRLRY